MQSLAGFISVALFNKIIVEAETTNNRDLQPYGVGYPGMGHFGVFPEGTPDGTPHVRR